MAEVTGSNEKATGVGLQPGARVGKYEIVGRIGAGGQAIVYKGYDALLDRHVGIKQISAHLAGDPRFLERFRKEAQILARLGGANSNIVGVHELVEDSTGLYMVMEYVSGHTLKAVLDHQEHAIPVEAALEILWHIAKGLRAAHGQGIVHRDIKPANIIVSRDYTAKITDFGVAAQSGGDDSMTLGTTKYMAPELFGSGKVDARSDIYSLGFIAYEMLTGRSFFRHLFADVVRDPHSENLRWMKWHADPTTTVPGLAEINPKVPEAVSAVVAKMMAKDLSERYSRIEEAMEDLRKAVGGLGRTSGRGGAVAAAMAQVDQARGDDSGGRPALDAAPVEAAAVEDEYPTDAIPKKRMAPRTKIILAAVAVAVAIAAGGALAVYFGTAEGRRKARAEAAYKKAKGIYDQARRTYRDGDLAKARQEFGLSAEQFAQFAAEYADLTKAATGAESRRLMNKAFLSLLDSQWDDAERLFGEARRLGVLTNEEAGSFTRELSVRREGLRLLGEAEAALAEGAVDLTRARDRLEKFAEIRGTPRDLSDRARALRRKADQIDKQGRFATLMTEGDTAVMAIERVLDGGVLDEEAVARAEQQESIARARYTDAKKIFPDDPRADDKLRILDEVMAYLRVRQDYEAAVAAKSWPRQIVSLKAMLKIRRTAADEAKLQVAQAEQAYAEGVQRREEGKVTEAKDAFRRSLAFAKLTKAEEALRQLEAAASLAELTAQAQSLMRQAKYADVVKLLAGNPVAAADPDLADMLQTARVSFYIEAGDAARRNKDWEKALIEYENARRAKPDDTLTARRVDTLTVIVNQERKFYHLVQTGEQLLKEKQYAQAVTHFTEAETLAQDLSIPPAEKARATAGKTDTRYAWELANGVAAKNRDDLDGAWAHFRQAQRLKDTPEVRKLIAEVDAARSGG